MIFNNVFSCFVSERDDLDTPQKVKLVKDILTKLAPAHYQTLKYLLCHLVRSV